MFFLILILWESQTWPTVACELRKPDLRRDKGAISAALSGDKFSVTSSPIGKAIDARGARTFATDVIVETLTPSQKKEKKKEAPTRSPRRLWTEADE